MLRRPYRDRSEPAQFPESKPTLRDGHLSTKMAQENRSCEKPFSALLSYVSIDHHEMKPMAKTKNCELCDSCFECKVLLGCWRRYMDIPRDQMCELSQLV